MTQGNVGRVLRVSRRNARVLTAEHDVHRMRVGNKIDKLTVGDHVEYHQDHGVFYVNERHARRNTLARTYRKRSKEIAANVDLICIIAAMQPLFNTHFVDRCLMLATLEQIPVMLVVNKQDLGEGSTEEFIATYRNLGIDVITSSVITPGGLDELRSRLCEETLEVVVLLGVSGVGKSSIFNELVPEASQEVGDVSEKTGQGTQTTSQSIGYRYHPSNDSELILVDLPGIQHFGVSNVDKALVRMGFSEFLEASTRCEYSDCYHLLEPQCGVQDDLTAGKISLSRYESYCGILDEIEAAREY